MTSEFGPSPLITTALTTATLAPALVILAIRGLWPNPWATGTLVTIATLAITVTLWFLRRAVPARNSNLWQIHRIHRRNDASGFLGLYAGPCVIALATPQASRWAALAALAMLAVVAARSSSVLTNNPLMVLTGLHTYEAQIHWPTTTSERAQTVTVLAQSIPAAGTAARLINIGRGIYVQAAERTTETDIDIMEER